MWTRDCSEPLLAARGIDACLATFYARVRWEYPRPGLITRGGQGDDLERGRHFYGGFMSAHGIGLVLVLLGGLFVYGARGGARLVDQYQSTNKHRIACQRAEEWLDEAISSSKKTTSTPPAELQVLRRHCWRE